MKRVFKNKCGFTLTEIILVVAIIILLAGGIMANVMGNINESKQEKDNVSSHLNGFDAAISQINDPTWNPADLPTATPTPKIDSSISVSVWG